MHNVYCLLPLQVNASMVEHSVNDEGELQELTGPHNVCTTKKILVNYPTHVTLYTAEYQYH